MRAKKAVSRIALSFVAVVDVIAIIGIVTYVTALNTYNSTSASESISSTVAGKYKVTYEQIGACSPTFWGIPWSVTIDNVTKAQPNNSTLPVNNYTLYGTNNVNFTKITFMLDYGPYSFSISPSQDFFTPTTGSFALNGSSSNLIVPIRYTGTSCLRASNSTTA